MISEFIAGFRAGYNSIVKRDCKHSVRVDNKTPDGNLYCKKCGARVGSVEWE